MAKLGEEKNDVGWTNKIKVLKDGEQRSYAQFKVV